jgi:hypothetical protein
MRFVTIFIMAIIAAMVPLEGSIKGQRYRCYVNSSWTAEKGRGPGGGIWEEGHFDYIISKLPDDHTITKTFPVQGERIATATIRTYYCDNKPCILSIKLEISEPESDSNSPENAANDVGAEISLNRKCQSIRVHRHYLIGDTLYYYELLCMPQ